MVSKSLFMSLGTLPVHCRMCSLIIVTFILSFRFHDHYFLEPLELATETVICETNCPCVTLTRVCLNQHACFAMYSHQRLIFFFFSIKNVFEQSRGNSIVSPNSIKKLHWPQSKRWIKIQWIAHNIRSQPVEMLLCKKNLFVCLLNWFLAFFS